MGSELDTCMRALLEAPAERRATALRVLTGESSEVPASARPEPFLTLREVSDQLGLSVTTLWRYGTPGHMLGGRRRFRMTEVLSYLDSDKFRDKAAALREERATVRHTAVRINDGIKPEGEGLL